MMEDTHPTPKRYEEMEKKPETVTPGDLNNFHRCLPGSEYRLAMLTEEMQSRYRNKFCDLLTGNDVHTRHSTLLLAQTMQEFFAVVDATVNELNLGEKLEQLRLNRNVTVREMPEWKSLEDQYKASKDNEELKDTILDRMQELQRSYDPLLAYNTESLRVYHALRRKGYTHMDLTGL